MEELAQAHKKVQPGGYSSLDEYPPGEENLFPA
jgi:hypothetical protein